ncbi:hypothetical protein VL03_14535 [Rossellomorea marisflavi]|nr:hypothetical protein VL03_14535 [Rossellomorea marisflavi]
MFERTNIKRMNEHRDASWMRFFLCSNSMTGSGIQPGSTCPPAPSKRIGDPRVPHARSALGFTGFHYGITDFPAARMPEWPYEKTFENLLQMEFKQSILFFVNFLTANDY